MIFSHGAHLISSGTPRKLINIFPLPQVTSREFSYRVGCNLPQPSVSPLCLILPLVSDDMVQLSGTHFNVEPGGVSLEV